MANARSALVGVEIRHKGQPETHIYEKRKMHLNFAEGRTGSTDEADKRATCAQLETFRCESLCGKEGPRTCSNAADIKLKRLSNLNS